MEQDVDISNKVNSACSDPGRSLISITIDTQKRFPPPCLPTIQNSCSTVTTTKRCSFTSFFHQATSARLFCARRFDRRETNENRPIGTVSSRQTIPPNQNLSNKKPATKKRYTKQQYNVVRPQPGSITWKRIRNDQW